MVGVEVTLAYTAGTVLLGLLLGLLIGLGRLSRSRLVNVPLIGLIEVFRCTPLLVQIVWFYYALPVILNVQIPAVVAATLVLSFYTAAFYAEIFRGGIVSIERGQWDAARALGLRPWQVMRLVVLPQAVRRMVPPFLNQSIIQLKNTSLVSTIAVPDLLYQGTSDHRGHVSPAGGVYRGGADLLRAAVPDDAAGAVVRGAAGARAVSSGAKVRASPSARPIGSTPR